MLRVCFDLVLFLLLFLCFIYPLVTVGAGNSFLGGVAAGLLLGDGDVYQGVLPCDMINFGFTDAAIFNSRFVWYCFRLVCH